MTNPATPDRAESWVDLGSAPLSAQAVLAFLTHERVGGTALFVGTPRRWTGRVETPWLEYEAYPEMARRQLVELATEALDRWALIRVAVLHRLGVVRPTEASVIVGVGSAHRAEAFEASRWLIDTLKSDVPVWKRDGAVPVAPRYAAWR